MGKEAVLHPNAYSLLLAVGAPQSRARVSRGVCLGAEGTQFDDCVETHNFLGTA